jgi:hypothetical protein
MAPVRTRYIALVSNLGSSKGKKRSKWSPYGGSASGGAALGGFQIDLSGTLSVLEGAVAGSLVGDLTTVPAGASLSLVDDAGGRFALNGAQLVTGSVATNYETGTQHNISVRALAGLTDTIKNFIIAVTDVDEINDITLSANTVAENTATSQVVGALTSSPAGATYTITSQTPAGTFFAISGGNLVTGATPTNYENNTSHSITVRGTRLSETFDKVFTINVTNVQEVTDIALSATTIAENATAGTVVGALTSTPAGASYSITSQTPSGTYFAISGGNLVAGATSTNFEINTSHSVTIQATLGADTYSEVFNITVTDVDEISDMSLSLATIPENSAPGTVVGALSSTPAGATFALAPSNTAGTLFAVSGTNLVAGATATNFETATSHVVTIRGTRGSEVYDEAFTITVTDVDEISDITLSPATIPENSATNTVVGALTSTPAGATFALAPSNTAGTLFAVSGTNLVAGATATNFETATSHVVTIRGTRLGETFDKGLTVTVTDVDEISDMSLSLATIAENSAPGTVVGALSSTPAGATFALAPSNTAGTLFAVSGTNLVAGATATNFETATSHVVTIRGTRGGEVYDEAFTITVTDVDEITAVDLSANTVTDGAASGQSVGTLSSTPAGATFTIQAQTPAGTYFTIVGSDLQTGATPTNAATNSSHLVTVRGMRLGEILDQDFTINVV